MDVIETLLKLPESERQKLLLLLTNAKTTNPSNDSAGPSGTDLKESMNLSSNTTEKPAPKQKTLDSWIVKNKTPTSNCEKKVTNSKEIGPISAKGEGTSSCDLEAVSCTLQDPLPCSSSISKEISSKPETVNQKKLRVLLDRKDCLESKQKSPEHSESSFEKVTISPIEIKSPRKKHTHVSENSDKKIASPDKHSATPPRSYNLRSARGVSDEKPSSETTNSLVIPSENEDRDKNHKLVAKQKPSIKTSVGKDASRNSSTCLKEVRNDQKNDSSNDVMYKENNQNSKCQIPSVVVGSELEKTSSVKSVDNDTIIATDENPIPAELDVALVGKGKRKRSSKDKESKKLCVASTDQKSSPNKMKVNSKIAQSIPSKKVVKFYENPSVLSIEKTVELPGTKESTSPNQKQISPNDTDKSVSKLKKIVKRKDKNDSVSHEETNLDSIPAKLKKKSIPNPEINSGINKNVSQNEILDMQLESETISESQSKESAEESAKGENSVSLVNADSKKIIKKRGNKNKNIKADKNSLLSDSEKTSKVNEEDNVTDDSTEMSSKIFPSQNKISGKETEEFLSKDMDTGTLVNADSKRISRKRRNENKSMKAAKKILLPDLKLVSRNIDEDAITSNKISPPKNNELAQETEELLKDANAVIPIKSSKKKIRKIVGENKNTITAEKRLSSDLEQASKNDEKHSIASAEISSKNSPSQSKDYSKETKELLIKDTNSATSENVGSKRTTRKRGTGNKSVVTTKNSLKPDLEQLSKSSDKDGVISIKTSSKISLPQNNESAKKTEQLIKDANTANALNVSSKKKLKTGTETKYKIAVKKILVSDGEKSSNHVNDNVTSTELLTINSSKNSPSQSKECLASLEAEELAIKDTNSSTSVNIGSRRTTRNRGTGNKSLVAAKNSLISDSKEAFKNCDKDSNTSIETLETDSSRNSPPVAKELSPKQISSINTTKEKVSLNNSNDELDSLNKMKELPDKETQKSKTVSSNLNKNNNNNALKHKVNALKKTVKVSTNSRKQVKVSKDQDQSNTPQNIPDNLDFEMENSDLNLKKNGSKKKVPSFKIKIVRDSSEEHLDVPITKSKVISSNSNVVQEPKHELLKNLKDQKETVSVKNSKEVKESHSKKKSNSLASEVDSINLSQNVEMEKLNSISAGGTSVKNKLCKTKINKKAFIKSTDKEKSCQEVESDSSPEKTESEHLSKKFLDVQMELDTFHSVEKSESCDNSTISNDYVNTEIAQEMISEVTMDTIDTSESEKVELDIISDMEEITEKEADFAVNNLNDADVVQTDFENSFEFDEQMKNNYQDFCKLKKVLEIIGISFKEFFDNSEILNCLNSDQPDDALKIHKCKLDSKISISMHKSIKKMNILNKLKRKK